MILSQLSAQELEEIARRNGARAVLGPMNDHDRGGRPLLTEAQKREISRLYLKRWRENLKRR